VITLKNIFARQLYATGRQLLAVLVAAMTIASLGCSGGPRFFRSKPTQFENPATIAVMPLLNMSPYERAEAIVEQALVVELLDLGSDCDPDDKKGVPCFQLVDPGVVETVILEKRLRFTDRLSLEQLKDMGDQLNVKYLLVGSVNEFTVVNEMGQEHPSVSISVRIVSCADGRILWASTHSKRGDDAETVFGIGRVETLEQLNSITVREMTETLKH